ncbi:MAG: hypothetical protein JSS66_10775 [Armatimonadetes bacterium]|nr:hypothetical protein [Armatimonadota bacterium]
MEYWKYHHEFNAMPLAIADCQRINGVVSLAGECTPISLNPAHLYISAFFLARAEKARLLCDLGKAIVERSRTRSILLEAKIAALDEWVSYGCGSGAQCFVTNALTIRTRRKPLKVTRRSVHEYLSLLVADSMPHQIDEQFKFFVGDYGNRVTLITEIRHHYLKLAVCCGVPHNSMPYPLIDHLCNDALGNSQVFLKNIE